MRNFIRGKGGRALFVEYDIASGNRLLPVYRVLIDLAIKEALGLGRAKSRGNVFFVLDEFALLPHLGHISNGINFGRSLGSKFMVGTQNVNQVLKAMGRRAGPASCPVSAASWPSGSWMTLVVNLCASAWDQPQADHYKRP